MNWKMLGAALGFSALAFVSVPAEAAGPVPAVQDKVEGVSPKVDVRHRFHRHRHCFAHRHSGHRHRHCNWHRHRNRHGVGIVIYF